MIQRTWITGLFFGGKKKRSRIEISCLGVVTLVEGHLTNSSWGVLNRYSVLPRCRPVKREISPNLIPTYYHESTTLEWLWDTLFKRTVCVDVLLGKAKEVPWTHRLMSTISIPTWSIAA